MVKAEDIVNKRFRIIKQLGYGSFGTVWKVQDIYNNTSYAIKFVSVYSSLNFQIENQDIFEVEVKVLEAIGTKREEGISGFQQLALIEKG